MATQYGTLSVLDTLAAYNATSVLKFGEAEMAGYVQLILDAYKALKADIVGDLVTFTEKSETTYGANTVTGEMVDLDEFGLADAQKIPYTPASVGFPLRRRGYTIQWTRDYLANSTPLELARQVVSATEADERKIYVELRRALFRATNNTGYVDRLTDEKNYTVRALVNGDSNPIPPDSLTATSWDASTHTHYLGSATFTAAALTALIETVLEHRRVGTVRVYINQAQEAAIRGFAGFNPYVDSRLVYGTAADRAAQTVDIQNTQDRAIGFFGPAEVWIKPWIPANYQLAFDLTAPEKPLAWRNPVGAQAESADLRLVADLDRHPLHARAWEHLYGIAAWNRIGAACMYSANATYASYTGI